MAVNLTGAALNPYTNSFLFFCGDKFITMDLNSGQTSSMVSLFNQNGESYFDNFRFNNSDSTIYGLARRNFYVNQIFSCAEMFLAKLNAETGEIQQISQNSIGEGFALAGSAIDPYQMVYYFSKGIEITGLDMYTGEVYSSFPINFPGGKMFDNFTYSCADTALYGLIRENFYSYDSTNTDFPMQILDSTSVKLGKINTINGELIEVSPVNLNFGGYSINASSAIEPDQMVYYFSSGGNIVGVSLISGLVVSNNDLSFEDGSYFDLMRNFNNCRDASRARLSSEVASVNEENNSSFNVCPNPACTDFKIAFEQELSNGEITITNQLGEIMSSISNYSGAEIEFKNQNLTAGIYFITIKSNDNQQIVNKKIVIQP